jgi:hypothetical protein
MQVHQSHYSKSSPVLDSPGLRWWPLPRFSTRSTPRVYLQGPGLGWLAVELRMEGSNPGFVWRQPQPASRPRANMERGRDSQSSRSQGSASRRRGQGACARKAVGGTEPPGCSACWAHRSGFPRAPRGARRRRIAHFIREASEFLICPPKSLRSKPRKSLGTND